MNLRLTSDGKHLHYRQPLLKEARSCRVDLDICSHWLHVSMQAKQVLRLQLLKPDLKLKDPPVR
jgi:hypothetical protein